MKYIIRPEYNGKARFGIYRIATRPSYTAGFFGLQITQEEYELWITNAASRGDAEEIVKHLCSEVKEIECSQST